MNNFIKKIKASLENFKTEIEFPPKDDSNKIFLYSFSNKYKISIKIISISLCVCILLSSTPFKIYANNTNDDNVSDNSINDSKTDDKIPVGSSTGHSNVRTVNDIISQQKFNSKTGHGFAAEQGNNYINKIKGTNAKVVGDNNVKNGPDRIIINRDGTTTLIQDKYYSNVNQGINACFDDATGMFRYVDNNGNPMQIEVPSDQYEAAVKIIEKKIKEGKIPNVKDPAEAKSIVRKGALSLKQAQNLAKAGTLESLSYDAAHGIVSSTSALGISFILNYSICILNGKDTEDALKESSIEGLKTGGCVFATSVIAGQLTKTGALNVFKPQSEALTKALGEDFSNKLLKVFGQEVLADSGESVAQTATKQAATLLRATVLTDVISIVVFTIPDSVNVFRGRISKTQFIKNFAVTAVSTVAATIGYGVGGLVSSVVVPGVGTVPGSIIGSVLLGSGAGFVTDKISDYITDDDADKMYSIIENQFSIMCDEYLVNEDEARNIANALNNILNDKLFKDMYQTTNREQFAISTLEPLFEDEVKKRKKIEEPSEEDTRAALKEELKGVVFIH